VAENDQPSKITRYRRERSDRLDALLRKIKKVGGVDHLADDEIAYLERVSEELSLELDAIDGELTEGPPG
jgi:hypothetical protein